jgi:aspartyl aminopeptidase
MSNNANAQGLIDFIESCPSMFHTTATIRERLVSEGFAELKEGDAWKIEQGGRYFVTRNGSSIAAFAVGKTLDDYHFQVAASHGDSPTYKIKAHPTREGAHGYVKLCIEAYGGMIDHTWFDRPLGVAGRVLVREGNAVKSVLYDSDRDVALIPSLAIHLNRESGLKTDIKRNVDLMPLFSAGELGPDGFDAMVASDLGVDVADVLSRDLFVVNREKAVVWGAKQEFVSSPKLDDLGCAYTSLEGFLAAGVNDAQVNVFVCFDNEEVGSGTKQGALSTFLKDCLVRLNAALGKTDEDYRRAVAKSFLMSCDNAHACSPNYPSFYDETNRCWLNDGLVIKEAANQHYCSDAFSRAVIVALLQGENIPYQTFANRSDMAGGGTLGNLSNQQVSMHGVDVGLPQLAMHSCYETGGATDVELGAAALEAFFSHDIVIDGADGFQIK